MINVSKNDNVTSQAQQHIHVLHFSEFVFCTHLVLQITQLWQRDHPSSIDDFKGWVGLRLNFTLKGYTLRHYDNALTYSMFTSLTERLWQSNIAYYGIKRPVHVIVSV